jgi:hypothetical protein
VPGAALGLSHPELAGAAGARCRLRDHDVTKGDRVGGLVGHVREASRGCSSPAEGLDLDLLDRVLLAARKEAGSVDVVVLPESAVDEREIEDLETLLQGHGVAYLNTGVRGRSRQPGRFPGNWLHIGINPRLEKGGPPPIGDPESWFHIRQNKHHRWSLDEGQITQYHLGGVLHPHVRWWEAMEVPRLAMQFVELAELTQASLVCEDPCAE